MLADDLRGMFYIALKDLKAYYFKPPNISWGILFPFAFILAFAIRNPGDLRALVPGLLALTILFGTSSMEAIVIVFERRIGSLERLAAGAGTAACLAGRQAAGRHDLRPDGDPGGAGGFPGCLWRRRNQLAAAVPGAAALRDSFFGAGGVCLGGGAGSLRGADAGELHPLPDDVPGRRVRAAGLHAYLAARRRSSPAFDLFRRGAACCAYRADRGLLPRLTWAHWPLSAWCYLCWL